MILGGGFAGILASRRLASVVASQGLDLALVNASDTFVERVRLHQVAAGEDVPRYHLSTLLAGTGARLVLGRAVALDLDARAVALETAAGPARLEYDHLLYALGSDTDARAVPGAARHAMPVASEPAARAVAEALRDLSAKGGGRVVVCGGGLTGIELATEVAEVFPNLELGIVTRGALVEGFSLPGRAHVRAACERLKIAVREQCPIAAVEAGVLRLADDTALTFDLCLWTAAFGVSPLAREAGLEVNARGQVITDDYLRARSHPEVFVAGDSAAPGGALRGPAIRMGCATAMPMGAAAGDNLAATLRGEPLSPFRFAYMAQFVSLGRGDALAQLTRSDDTPTKRVLTGRAAGAMKELTFRMNLSALHTGIYPWQLIRVLRWLEWRPALLAED